MNNLKNTSKSRNFDSVFEEIKIPRNLSLKNNNCLRCFCLDISNNKFNYSGLHKCLQRNIGAYVFSRVSIQKFVDDDDVEAIGLKAVELLRKVSNPNDNGAGGELGEILLYLLLEQKLHAPKLLSKVELKTSRNQYVYGSDGVHLLALDDKKFQLVLGESKIKNSLKGGLVDAFDSIKKVAENPDNDVRLIDINIFQETFTDEDANFIKSLIIPEKKNRAFSLDKAFAIFLGYSLDIDGTLYSNEEFREKVFKIIRKNVCELADAIESKINSSGLYGYSFYFFIVPFNEASKDRALIMGKLMG